MALRAIVTATLSAAAVFLFSSCVTSTARQSTTLTGDIEVRQGEGWTMFILPADRCDLGVVVDSRGRTGRRDGSTPDLVVGANPWRRGGFGNQIPVGFVQIESQVVSAARDPYWSVGWNGLDLWMVPQREAQRQSGSAVGGFYPLLIDGRNVADGYPGAERRSARVAVGWDRDGELLFVLAVDGERPFAQGMTTGETATILQQAGCFRAMNLDGGRSAFVRARPPFVRSTDTLPRIGGIRRPGPVSIGVWYNGGE